MMKNLSTLKKQALIRNLSSLTVILILGSLIVLSSNLSSIFELSSIILMAANLLYLGYGIYLRVSLSHRRHAAFYLGGLFLLTGLSILITSARIFPEDALIEYSSLKIYVLLYLSVIIIGTGFTFVINEINVFKRAIRSTTTYIMAILGGLILFLAVQGALTVIRLTVFGNSPEIKASYDLFMASGLLGFAGSVICVLASTDKGRC